MNIITKLYNTVDKSAVIEILEGRMKREMRHKETKVANGAGVGKCSKIV